MSLTSQKRAVAIERLAEEIWQAEWMRGGNTSQTRGRRKIPWSEVQEVDAMRYRFTATHLHDNVLPLIAGEP